MYHSIYENFHWMETVVDPTFEYHAVMARIQGLASLRLANATLLPFDFANEADYWKLAYDDLLQVAKARDQNVPRFDEAWQLLDSWQEEATALEQEMEQLLTADLMTMPPSRLQELDQMILDRTRDFHREVPTPENPAQRNLFSGSSYDFEAVSGGTLPGLRFALDRTDSDAAKREADLYLEALQQRVDGLRAIRSSIKALLDSQ
jgi:N-acetylated-alpha-linked acidic dipeptidase